MKIRIEFRRKKRRRTQNLTQSKAYRDAREKARAIIVPRVDFIAQTHGYSYNRIDIRNQKTRWGSCSSKNNLNFNMKLVHLRLELMDYVIAHELVHTRHMNHSRAFWDELERITPQSKLLHKELRKIQI